jgi:hypothetical protein
MASPMASTGLKAPQHRTKATVGVSAARDFASRPDSVSEVRAFTRDALAGHDSGGKKLTLLTPSDADGGGRGLLLVQALTSRWGVTSWPLGKCVRFEIDGDPSALQGCRRAGRAGS